MSDGNDAGRFGFAAETDAPIAYLQRIRDYYQALGYGPPYRWAHYAEVPFAPMTTPLAEARIALVTTAAPYQPGRGDQGPGAPYNAAAKFLAVYSGDTAYDHDLRISHIAYDRDHTTAEDSNSWFPLPAPRQPGGSARSRRASMACRPTAAIARHWKRIARNCSDGCAATARTRRSLLPSDRCATRP